MSDKKRIRLITFLALYVAIYVVLKYIGDLIPIFNMPNGGSVEVELIAVCLASYHLGWKGGAMTGLLSWLVTIVLGFVMYFVHPVQIALDYVLPLVVCGLASLFGNYVDRGRKERSGQCGQGSCPRSLRKLRQRRCESLSVPSRRPRPERRGTSGS